MPGLHQSFDVDLATKYGIDAAILIQEIQKNPSLSVQDIKCMHPYITDKKFDKAIKTLKKEGFINE